MAEVKKDERLISVEEIVQAGQRLRDVAVRTPIQLNETLSMRYDCNVYLKREDLQVVRSFKIRGAYNKMKSMSASELENGVVCASAGNHAQGVAYSCKRLKVKGTIVMPTTTPTQKRNKVKHHGGKYVGIILHGDTFDDSSKYAYEISEEKNIPYIHPFNDRLVMAGQGTVAMEILEDMDKPVDYLFVSVGGGGLISGMGSYFKVLSPKTKIIAVEAMGAPSLKAALDAGHVVELDEIDAFADGIATKSVGDKTFAISKQIVDDHVAIPEGMMCSKIIELYNDDAIVVEPSSASTVAALEFFKKDIKGKNVVCVLSGSNNDITRMEDIKERSLLFEKKKHYFIVRFPQRAGALKDFLDVLGPNDDIAYFQYTKKTNRENGPAIVGIEFKKREDFGPFIKKLKASGFPFEHLNNNPLLFEMLV